MGQELQCRMHRAGVAEDGKAWLETGFLLFRGAQRLKVPFSQMQAVRAEAGLLKLELAGAPLAFELGSAAEKWAGKILHPPSRAHKLGVKTGLSYRLEGEMEEGFEAELKGCGAAPAEGRAKADLVFFATCRSAGLVRIRTLARGMRSAGGLWVVYPKGTAEIREIEVLEAGRAAGLKDVKVVSFSPTHTALRFVVPLAQR
jgi:hypothetical protein